MCSNSGRGQARTGATGSSGEGNAQTGISEAERQSIMDRIRLADSRRIKYEDDKDTLVRRMRRMRENSTAHIRATEKLRRLDNELSSQNQLIRDLQERLNQ